MTLYPSVGDELASRVADQLEDGMVLAHVHRGFCGMGLEVVDGRYVYGEVNNGLVYIDHPGRHHYCGGAVFETRDTFVGWLSGQTDLSLCGRNLEWDVRRGDQRLDLFRLKAFANGRGVPKPENRPVGRDIASRVADRLEAGDVLAYAHRDYCGMGVAVVDGVYVYARAPDGWVLDAPDGAFENGDGARFVTREAFVDWLARQTDPSLAGHDLERDFYRFNQRLTVDQLHDFADGGDGRV